MLEYIPYIFTRNEIAPEFRNEKQLQNWLLSKQRSKFIKKVRNGLYVFEANSRFAYSSKFEIASRITKDAYVGYHSALEFYGLGNQRFYNVYVCSSTRFNDFEFEQIDYVYRASKLDIEIVTRSEVEVRVTSLERTIIDCIDNIGLAGGIEELLHAITDVEHIREEKLLKVLEAYNCVFLYQKTGYLLEHFKERLELSDQFFEICRSKLTNQVKYFLKEDYSDLAYNSKWNLIAPTNLLFLITEGTYGLYEE